MLCVRTSPYANDFIYLFGYQSVVDHIQKKIRHNRVLYRSNHAINDDIYYSFVAESRVAKYIHKACLLFHHSQQQL